MRARERKLPRRHERGVTIRIGCCGWAESQVKYFRHFSAIEIQRTFYQPPRLQTLVKWRASAPPEFEFTLKAWQLITHEPSSPTYRRLKTPIPEKIESRYGAFRPTEEVLAAWQTTVACANALGARIVVFQCPASFEPTQQHIQNFRCFFASARREASNLLFAWEPRGGWCDALVKELCEEFKLIHAVDPFARQPVSPGLRYIRLHGIGGYRSSYSNADLDRLASWCRHDSYVMFNNITMAQDALLFRFRPAPVGAPSARTC
jgi:uncharacterized protein YecE (DUF72 family)